MAATGAARVVLAGLGRDPSEEAMKSAVRAVAERATDFSWLKHGDAVFIKPALNSGNPYPATTNPVAVAAMAELLREKGAGRVIVGDMCGIEHVKLTPEGVRGKSSRSLMQAAGLARRAEAAGAELHFFEEAGWDAFYEDVPTADSHWPRGLMMPAILRQVDHIVLMPRCSRHALLGASLGLKAAVGYWRTDTRLEYHSRGSTIHEQTAEGNTVATLLGKQRLVLSAADKILATFGPDQGVVIQPEAGLVMASGSVVAHDMVSLAWLIENRRGLRPSWLESIKDNWRLVAWIGNRWIVSLLGGPAPALRSEGLVKNRLETLWDDRVLNHAYRVLGGRPRVALEAANDGVPGDVMRHLGEALLPRASAPAGG